MGSKDRAQLQQSWRNHPDLLAGVLATAMDAIIVLDDAEQIVLFNSCAETMFGCSASDAIGSSIERFVPERFREAHSTYIRRFGDTGVTTRVMGGLHTLWGLRADGKELPIEASIAQTTIDGSKFFTVVVRDATERIRAEHMLKSGEQRNRDLVLFSPVAMIVTRGPLYENELVSLKFTKLFGYTIQDVPDEAHWWPLAYPDEAYREMVRAKWQEHVQKAASRRQKQIEPMEAIVQCKDGSKRHIEFHFSFFGETNLVSFVDLTERERIQTALRESEGRFREIADAAPVLIWMSGTDRLCNYFNQPWLDFTGRPLKAELGEGWAEGVHSEDVQACLQIYSEAFSQRESFNMEYRLRRHDGQYRWIFDVGVPRFDSEGTFLGYIGSCVDITERKNLEQERFLLENRFRQFFETMPEYCFMISPKGEIVDTNPAACSALGYTEDELVGKPVSVLYAPECHARIHELLKRWRVDGALRNEEMVVVTRQGLRRTVLLNVGSVKDSDGNILHSTSVQVDITERKRGEEALRTSEERLRLAQQAASIGVFEWNIQAGVNTWSPELETMYGLPKGSFGQTQSDFENLVHPEDRDAVRKLIDWALKTGQQTQGQWRIIWPDGSVHWIFGKWQVFHDESGKPLRMTGVNMDVTERKGTEQALAIVSGRLIGAQEEERRRIARELHDDINQRVALIAVDLERWEEQASKTKIEGSAQVRHAREHLLQLGKDIQELSHRLHSSKLDYLGIEAAARSCLQRGLRQAQGSR
jgi:PAS domain S-box-containing protein